MVPRPPTSVPCQADLNKACQLLKTARKPLVIIGKGKNYFLCFNVNRYKIQLRVWVLTRLAAGGNKTSSGIGSVCDSVVSIFAPDLFLSIGCTLDTWD